MARRPTISGSTEYRLAEPIWRLLLRSHVTPCTPLAYGAGARWMMKRMCWILVVMLSSACGGGNASPTAPQPSSPIAISAEAIAIDTRILTSSACPTRFGFGLNVTLIVRGVSGARLRVITFEFIDRFGHRSRPD